MVVIGNGNNSCSKEKGTSGSKMGFSPLGIYRAIKQQPHCLTVFAVADVPYFRMQFTEFSSSPQEDKRSGC